MLASSEVMDALKSIGLNLYERKLWVALLAKGVATAGELSAVANVPRSRSYDVLQTLADKGFVIVQTSKPLKYVTVSPKEALGKAKDRLKESYLRNTERIAKLQKSKIVEELDGIHNKGLQLVSPEDLTGALKGKYSVLQQMDSMLKNATSSVSIVTTPVGLNELFENQLSILKKLKDKGVKIRIAIKADEKCSEAIKALSGVAEVKNISDMKVPLHGNFYVIDKEQLSMGLSDPESVHTSQQMMFWTKSKHAAESLGEPLFNLVWENSSALTSGRKAK
ncbi:MAG: TrmB family transcriptional regulator [Candidatus Aenigmarchaeota archaeon]|nr:TrmB family transcriptional regulator [Candidatus Aenigmarchaeota archaeon]